MSKRDYYEILGITKSASKKDIKKSYKKLALKCHPDKNPNDINAEKNFKELKEAYETLIDDEKRQEYDQFGHNGFKDYRNTNHNSKYYYDPNSDIFNDTFQERYNPFSGGTFENFENIFTQRSSRSPQPQKGQDLEFSLFIDFIDSIQGAEKIVELPINDKLTKIKVKIPPGIRKNEKIRFSGKGESGINGGKPGDLFLVISIKPHPNLKRKDNDLLLTTHIDMVTAALGGEKEIQILDRKFKFKIPAGTQSGRKFKMAGKGVTNRKGIAGDLLITVCVDTPTNITEQQSELLEKFKATLN